jgi:hypothetical protein
MRGDLPGRIHLPEARSMLVGCWEMIATWLHQSKALGRQV